MSNTSVDTENDNDKQSTFGAIAAKMFTNEQARVKRGEFSYESVKVLRNRLDAHLLPRWGSTDIKTIDYAELLKLTQQLSETMSTNTISQYLVIVADDVVVVDDDVVEQNLTPIYSDRHHFTADQRQRIYRLRICSN